MRARRLVAGTVRYRRNGRYVYGRPNTKTYAAVAEIAAEIYNGRAWVPHVRGLTDLSTVEERKRS